ncbi:MAG: L,D-transpeptidase family protein [Pseudomonadota bacterium]
MTPWLRVDLAEQRLTLMEDGETAARWPVSTGAAGPGERDGSGGTPRGWHYVRARIGAGMPAGTTFRGRRPTGEIWSPALEAEQPGRDWVLTRILWLCGLEPGRNRGGEVDTFRRYIYIHGTPEGQPMGEPRSHGCIRMRNDDIIELFDRVPAGTRVHIAGPGEPAPEGP